MKVVRRFTKALLKDDNVLSLTLEITLTSSLCEHGDKLDICEIDDENSIFHESKNPKPKELTSKQSTHHVKATYPVKT